MPERIPLHEYPARRIALIKPSALGDIVHSLPVLTALRRRYPRAHIAWIVNRFFFSSLRCCSRMSLAFSRASSRRGLPPERLPSVLPCVIGPHKSNG